MRYSIILLIILLLIPVKLIFSQEFPIPANGAQWNNSEFNLEDISNTQNVERIEARGDTLINGVVFHKLFKTWYSSYYQIGDCEFKYSSGPLQTNDYVGALRTDSNKRVFYIATADSVVRTLYDFSLNVGDTVYINGKDYQYTAEVTDIDSVLIDGSFRKRFDLQGYMFDRWIEGIGSIYGLFAPINRHWEKHGYKLICYVENAFTIYQYSSDSECFRCNLVSEVSAFQTTDMISVIPNPVVGKSYIDYPAHIVAIKANIYNEYGSLVNTFPIKVNEIVYIDKEIMKKGLFIVELIDKRNQVYHTKFIIQ